MRIELIIPIIYEMRITPQICAALNMFLTQSDFKIVVVLVFILTRETC